MGKVLDTVRIKNKMKHIRLNTPAPRVETMLPKKPSKYKPNYLDEYEEKES